MLSMIAAITPTRVIGKNGVMPWHLPADLAWFKQNTLGKPVIMGRKTWDSIGRPLPNRTNIVVSRSNPTQQTSAIWVNQFEDALSAAGDAPEVMIIGGAQLYEYFLPQAQRLYLTLIEADLEGDTWFPDYQHYQWNTIYQQAHSKDAKNPYNYTFMILERA